MGFDNTTIVTVGENYYRTHFKNMTKFQVMSKKNGNFGGRSGHYYDKNKEQTQKHYRYNEKGGKEKLNSIMKGAKGGYRR